MHVPGALKMGGYWVQRTSAAWATGAHTESPLEHDGEQRWGDIPMKVERHALWRALLTVPAPARGQQHSEQLGAGH